MLHRPVSSNAVKYLFVVYFVPIVDSFHIVAFFEHVHRCVAYCSICEKRADWKTTFNNFNLMHVCVVSNTYDAVFDVQPSPASAHSASSASRLEYDGVGTDELLLLFDLKKERKQIM